jgi:hypothetical protein
MFSSCSKSKPRSHPYGMTLRDYAKKARERGSREALVPYWTDEEEGEMLEIQNFEDAIHSYEWIVGEPIEERTLAVAGRGMHLPIIFSLFTESA